VKPNIKNINCNLQIDFNTYFYVKVGKSILFLVNLESLENHEAITY